MPSGYRNFLATACGLAVALLIGYGAASNSQHRYNETPPQRLAVGTTPTNRIQTETPSRPCRYHGDWNEVSACASLSQARSAIIANVRGERDSRNIGFSVLVGIGTLIAAIVAAVYAGKAANETWRGANAAADAVEQNRETNRLARLGHDLEYRPLLVFHSFEIEPFGNNGFLIYPVWLNIGRLPAYITDNTTRRIYTDQVPQQQDVAILKSDAPHRSNSDAVVPAGGKFTGGAKIVTSGEIVRVDTWPPGRTPSAEFLKTQLEHGFGRFRSKNRAFFMFGIIYRAAIGADTDWYTEQLVCAQPIWDETGRMKQDQVATLSLSHLETFKMT